MEDRKILDPDQLENVSGGTDILTDIKSQYQKGDVVNYRDITCIVTDKHYKGSWRYDLLSLEYGHSYNNIEEESIRPQ